MGIISIIQSWLKPTFANRQLPGFSAATMNPVMETIQALVDACAWKSTRVYDQNDPTFFLGVPYKSLISDNSDNQPDISPDKWQVTGGGAGNGDIGYIFENGQFEASTQGWVRYKDAAGASPVDGMGGTPTGGLALARIVASDLTGKAYGLLTKGANTNFQGEGVSYDFGIDRGQRMKPCQVQFSYETSASYADGDVGVFIYDVTNGNLIPASIQEVPGTSGQAAYFMATFLPSYNSGAYRLIIHVTVATTQPWTLKLDNVRVGTFSQAVGTAIGNWTDFTIVSAPINMPSGTWTKAKYARRGDTIKVKAMFLLTGAVTGAVSLTAASILASLGLSADMVMSQIAYCVVPGQAFPLVWNYSTAGFSYNGAVVAAAVPFSWASGHKFEIEFEAIVNQWVSNVNLASDFTRCVASGNRTDADDTDYTNSVLGLSGALFPTVPFTSGRERYLKFSTPSGVLDKFEIELQVAGAGPWIPLKGAGGVDWSYQMQNGASYGIGIYSQGADATMLKVRFGQYAFSNGLFGAAGASWASYSTWRWRVRRVSNGNMAEVSPNVRAEYSNQTSGSVGPMTYATKVEDTHNAVTTGAAWKFTAPYPGVYKGNGGFVTNSTVNDHIVLYKNGVPYRYLGMTGGLSGFRLAYAFSIRLAAGDYIDIRTLTYGPAPNVLDYIVIERAAGA